MKKVTAFKSERGLLFECEEAARQDDIRLKVEQFVQKYGDSVDIDGTAMINSTQIINNFAELERIFK